MTGGGAQADENKGKERRKKQDIKGERKKRNQLYLNHTRSDHFDATEEFLKSRRRNRIGIPNVQRKIPDSLRGLNTIVDRRNDGQG
jgi:hypothetical protein